MPYLSRPEISRQKSTMDLLFSKRSRLLKASLLGTATHQAPTSPFQTPMPPSAEYNCGDNAPVDCDNNNLAYKYICDSLANYLDANYGSGVPIGPRSICNQDQNNQCCTSWANDAPNLVDSMLIPGLTNALNTCDPQNPMVSARVHNAKLGQTCTTQCLSNRPTHCTNN
jgi:hypothetical protein